MLLSAVSVLVVAQSSSEIPEVLMNNPVYCDISGRIFSFLNNVQQESLFLEFVITVIISLV